MAGCGGSDVAVIFLAGSASGRTWSSLPQVAPEPYVASFLDMLSALSDAGADFLVVGAHAVAVMPGPGRPAAWTRRVT